MGRKQGFGGIKKDVCACVCVVRGETERENGKKEKRSEIKQNLWLLYCIPAERGSVEGHMHTYTPAAAACTLCKHITGSGV